jgi:hypothetical protein
VTLLRGALVSYTNPRAGAIPTVVVFQYNPTAVTRTFRAEAAAAGPGGAPGGGILSGAWPAPEEYALTLELDATDGLERDGPVTRALGIAPRIAAIEMLMQPVGTSLLGRLAARRCAPIPAGTLPRTLFAWGPNRVTPVRLTSLVVRETAFDELLNPIHASAELGFSVIRPDDADAGDVVTRAAALVYQGAREAKALIQLEQIAELQG